MEFLYLLEKLRTPWLTEIMLAVTELGGETAFLALALIVFWCVDKRRGYYLMSVGFITTICNQFLKMFCRVPRPWVKDPDFHAVEEALPEATGYSFPSGHSQSSVGVFGCLAVTAKKNWMKALCIALMVLVPFSRMYLGVHTPADVLVGAGISLALVFALRPVVYSEGGMKWLIPAMVAISGAYLAYSVLCPVSAGLDLYNLEHGRESAATLFGSVAAIAVVYPIEKKWVNFPNGAVWWAQILKIIGGLAVVLAVKGGLKAPLAAIMPELAARTVRYFLVVVTAGLLWPLTFRWFEKLGRKNK